MPKHPSIKSKFKDKSKLNKNSTSFNFLAPNMVLQSDIEKKVKCMITDNLKLIPPLLSFSFVNRQTQVQ